MDTISKSCKNKHLNAFECYKLEVLLKAKVSVLEIAKILCRAKSTIYREINQGTVKVHKSDWSVKKKEYRAYYSLNIRQDLMSKTGRKLQYNIEYNLLDYIQSKLDEEVFPRCYIWRLKASRYINNKYPNNI